MHTCAQAYFMVHRALAHMLVLPWPETPDPQQRWEERSDELTSLVTGSTAVLHQLMQRSGWTQDTQLQQQGMCKSLWPSGQGLQLTNQGLWVLNSPSAGVFPSSPAHLTLDGVNTVPFSACLVKRQLWPFRRQRLCVKLTVLSTTPWNSQPLWLWGPLYHKSLIYSNKFTVAVMCTVTCTPTPQCPSEGVYLSTCGNPILSPSQAWAEANPHPSGRPCLFSHSWALQIKVSPLQVHLSSPRVHHLPVPSLPPPAWPTGPTHGILSLSVQLSQVTGLCQGAW